MKLLFVFISASWLPGTAVADLGLGACAGCLLGLGDGECSQECQDYLNNLDENVHKCCDFWVCSSCPSTSTLIVDPEPITQTDVLPPGKTTTWMATKGSTTTVVEPTKGTTTVRRLPTRPPVKTTTHRTTTGTKTTTTGAVPTDIVAIVYEDSQCTGKSASLTTDDFVGGSDDSAWDACHGLYDDKSPIQYQKDYRTWLRSIKVMEGYTVATSTQCRDDFNYGSPSETQVKDIINAESGCISTTYDFNMVDFNPPVATVYQQSGCTGRNLTLYVQDFVGGNGVYGGDTAWDACNGDWSDGTAMTYDSTDHTWLQSIQVAPGFTVTTATQCNDDYTYDQIYYKDTLDQSEGCVDAGYDFNHIDYAVAEGSIAYDAVASTTKNAYKPL